MPTPQLQAPAPAPLNPRAAFEGVAPAAMEIRCLRRRDVLGEQVKAAHWYSTLCTEDADLPVVEALLAQHGAAAAATAGAPGGEGEAGGLPPVNPDIYTLQVRAHAKSAAQRGC